MSWLVMAWIIARRKAGDQQWANGCSDDENITLHRRSGWTAFRFSIFRYDLPPYPDGKAGELWVLRTAEGEIDLVSSDLQPDHPQWPGKVKGWPVPSLAYQRERWELYRKLAEGSVETY